MNGYKHPYLSARQQLSNAALKLRRAIENDGFDPVSGFSTEAIVDWIEDFPKLGDNEVIEQAKAVLRRHGFTETANRV